MKRILLAAILIILASIQVTLSGILSQLETPAVTQIEYVYSGDNYIDIISVTAH